MLYHMLRKRFKNRIKDINVPVKYRAKVYTEFKSTLLDKDYRRIKNIMLEEIRSLDGVIIYSCYIKKTPIINQVQKESIYITLLSSILSSVDNPTTVYFDRFGKKDFEDRIISSTEGMEFIKSICPRDSQVEPGLQFVDNICSVIRLYKSNEDINNYYDMISDLINEV